MLTPEQSPEAYPRRGVGVRLIHRLFGVDPGVVIEGFEGWWVAVWLLSPRSDVSLVSREGLVLQIESFNERDLFDAERLIIGKGEEVLDSLSLSVKRLAI